MRRPIRIAAAAATLAFAQLVAMSVHGYSVGEFDKLLPRRSAGAQGAFRHLGKSQPRRSDEFMVSLPLVAAQCRSGDFFPAFNGECFVEPTDMFVMTPPCPVFDWTLPGQFPNWGYLLFGLERGMAWNWWSRYLLLPACAFAFFLLCTSSAPLAALAAFSITLGAPTQWWTTTMPYHLSLLFAALLSAWGVVNSRGVAGVAVSAACLLVSASSFSFFFYPPFQYPLLLLFGALLPLMPRRGGGQRPLVRRTALAIVFALLAAELAYFAVRHGATLAAISRSVYPGRRCSTGGPFVEGVSLSLFKFVSLFDSFFAPGRTNPCAYSMYFAPLVPTAAAAVWLQWLRRRDETSGPSQAKPLAAFTLFLALWTFLQCPKWVGEATFFKIVTTERCAVVLSLAVLASMLLLFHALSKRHPMPWPLTLGVAIPSSALCATLCLSMEETRGYFLAQPYGPALLAAGVVLYLTTSLGLLRASRVLFYSSCAVAAVLQGWFVNPLCIGASPLTDSELPRAAAAIEAKYGSGAWVSADEYLSQFLVANGFKCLGGVMSQPRPEIWGQIDPALDFAPVWNRYAHVQAAVTDTGKSHARLLNEAKIIWNLSAKDAATLGARYLILPHGDWRHPVKASPIASAAGFDIYLLDSTADNDSAATSAVYAPQAVRERRTSETAEFAFPSCVEVLGAHVVADTPTNAVVRALLSIGIPRTGGLVPVKVSVGVADADGKVLFECPGLSLVGLQRLGDKLEGKVVEVDIPGAIPPDFTSVPGRKFALVFRDALSGERLSGRDAVGRKTRRVSVRKP